MGIIIVVVVIAGALYFGGAAVQHFKGWPFPKGWPPKQAE